MIAWLAIVDAYYISNGTTKHCTGFVGNFGAIFGPCTITVCNWNISSIKLQQEKKRKEKNCIRKEKKSALYIYSTPPHSLLSKNEKSKQQKYNLITKHLCKTYLHVGNGNNRIRERRKKTVTPKPSVLNGGPLSHGVV